MDNKTVQIIINNLRQGYNTIAKQFSHTRNREWHEFSVVANYLRKGDAILDLGCGNGRLLHYLKDKKVRYAGLDFSDNLIKIAIEQTKHFKLPPHRFICGNFTEIPFKEQKFDMVVAIASIYHIPSKELRVKVFREVYRVLKHNGVFIMTFWNLWQKSMIGLVAKNILLKLILKSPYDFFDIERPWKNANGEVLIKRYGHAFTFSEIKNICQRENFEILKLFYNRKGNRSHAWNGYNGVLIAKKR